MSQFGTFFLTELADGFTVLILGNLLIVDASPVDLNGRIETFAFDCAFIDTFVAIIKTSFLNFFF